MELPIIVSAISLVFFLIISVPIGVAMGLCVALGLLVGDLPPQLMMQKMYMALDSFPLLAVPLFILSGEIMQKGSMANSLLKLSRSLVGHIHGGMAHISVLTALFYGALCGSAPATVAAVGGIMIPAMEKEKSLYNEHNKKDEEENDGNVFLETLNNFHDSSRGYPKI